MRGYLSSILDQLHTKQMAASEAAAIAAVPSAAAVSPASNGAVNRREASTSLVSESG